MKVKLVTMMSITGVGFLSLLACSKGQNLSSGSPIYQETYGTPVAYLKYDINANPLDKTVCDPFNDQPAVAVDKGVKASLFYQPAGQPRLSNSMDYVTKAHASGQKLFFADLNVPTRLFNQGFASQTHDVVNDDQGQKLIEYFGLKFETTLKLAANDEEGDYELALLADDGTTLKVGAGDIQNVLISNDGDHPTRMGCASDIVHMTKDSSLPITLTYYQGPRYHIANVLLWRKANQAGKDVLCGQNGNNLFFDPDHGSAPQSAFLSLQARGWKVVSQDNFYLPASESYNPCVQGTAPVIANFMTNEIFSSGVFLSWETDLPASSQVKIVNKATGEVVLTAADNALRTTHSVQVLGLAPGTDYTAQAVSITADLGRDLSDILNFTTK